MESNSKNHRDFIGEMITKKISEANSGNSESAKWLLGQFVSAVKSNTDKDGLPYKKPSGTGTQIHEDVIRYVAERFQSVLDGVPADKALGINKGEAGANPISKNVLQQREYEWCLDVLRNQASGKYEKLEDAKAATARRFKVSVSAISKAWKRKGPKLSAKITLDWGA